MGEFYGLVSCIAAYTKPISVFDALSVDLVTGQIHALRVGDGTVAALRASSNWQSDYLGMFREFGLNEPAILGARVEGAVGSRECYAEDDNWWYVVEPESTNLYPYSRILTTNPPSGIVQTASAGPDVFGANESNHIAAAAVSGVHWTGHSTALENATEYVLYVIVRKGEQDWCQLTVNGTPFDTNIWINFNCATGLFGNKGTGTFESDSEYLAATDAWLVAIKATTKAASSTYSLMVGLTNNTDAASRLPSYTGDGVSGIYCDHMQVEAGVRTSPIRTSGAAVTRPADLLQFDLANHDQNRGCYTLEMIPIAPTYGPISLRASSDTSLLYINNATQLRTNDGANLVSTAHGLTVGVSASCGLTYDTVAALMTNKASTGSIGADTAYDGAFTINSTHLLAGVEVTAPFMVRNLKRYDVPYDEGKAILELLT